MSTCLSFCNVVFSGKTVAQLKTEADSLYTWVKTNLSNKYSGEEELILNCLSFIRSTGQWTDIADIKTQANSLYDWVLVEIN
jgi:hypothetical protein